MPVKQIDGAPFKYRSPWRGVVTRRNDIDLQPNEFPFCNNIVLFGDQISNKPAFNNSGANYVSPLSAVVLFAMNGLLFALSPNTFARQNPAASVFPTWIAPVSLGANINLLSDVAVANGIAYFSTQDNANHGYVSTLDANGTYVQNAANYVGGFYISQLANHILLANCWDNAGNNLKNRFSWSAENLPLVWDSTVNTNAGFIDVVDISDFITGLVNVDSYNYLLRTYGISQISATGNGQLPFSIQHLTSPQYQGKGCVFPNSLDSDGQRAIWVSQEGVEILTGSNGLQDLGGDATPFIMRDIRNSGVLDFFVSTVGLNWLGASGVIGSIVPHLMIDYSYPMYVLAIPYTYQGGIPKSSVIWICDLSNNSWTRTLLPNWVLQAKIRVAGVPTASNASGGHYPTLAGGFFPIVSQFFNGTGTSISPWSSSGAYAIASDEAFEVDFRTENTEGLWFTTRNIRIYYQDVGAAATLTCILTGVTESGAVLTNSASCVTAGLADGDVKVLYCPLELSCMMPSLKITATAGTNFSILGVDIVGNGSELETI